MAAVYRTLYEISIHALREEGDLSNNKDSFCYKQFLSTPSARRATVTIDGAAEIQSISIHALREEGDAPRPHRHG